MRIYAAFLAIFVIAACATPVPDSGANIGEGVGFGTTQDFEAEQARLASERAARQVELAGSGAVAPPVISNETVNAGAPATTPDPVIAPAVAPNNAGISDEQDFGAVSERESIESDRERLQEQRAQYQVVKPTALPSRTGSGGPNIVQYALSTTNGVGQRVYRRATVFAQAKYERNCAKYRSPDRAQEDFLAKGGPERDRLGLDPDGDGFACDWDPSPYRRAVN